ncbi:uncharacterized protein [Macrobrachium rosenbergii]|uniref:uncharacterized protein n=1 Tax=Macrobrachium rosenbergii TaxID=79674 RepID=UPI0034D6D70F
MHFSKLILAVVALTWVSTTDALLPFATPALILGGLAVLKGAAIFTLIGGPFKGKRSADDALAREQSEAALLSTVENLDPSGCILKLLCHLQFKEESTRTPEENTLVQMFSGKAEGLTSQSAAFVFAAEIGSKNKDAAVCEKYFNKCPYTSDEVGNLLHQSWGCNNPSV